MKLVDFCRVRTQSAAIEAVQDAIVRYIRQLQSNPTLDGRMIDVSITGGSNKTVNHNLGRTPVSWILCDIDANTVPYRVSWNETEIVLTAANNCCIRIWVA